MLVSQNTIPAVTSTAGILAAQSGVDAELVNFPGEWVITAIATAGTPSAVKAAGIAGVRHICTGISVKLGAAATAQPAIQVNLLDGATILASWVLAAPVNSGDQVSLPGLNIPGSAATSMTLQFASACAAAVIAAVNLIGYDAQ